MARCEDYPCCGHESGDCPRIDSRGRERWRCVECGKTLSLRASSSICAGCMRRAERRFANGEDMFPD
jgi:transposase-like protein